MGTGDLLERDPGLRGKPADGAAAALFMGRAANRHAGSGGDERGTPETKRPALTCGDLARAWSGPNSGTNLMNDQTRRLAGSRARLAPNVT